MRHLAHIRIMNNGFFNYELGECGLLSNIRKESLFENRRKL